MAAHACLEGGDIILLAECPDGLGRSDFLKWFEAKDSQELAQRLCKDYEVNGQTAWALLIKSRALSNSTGFQAARRRCSSNENASGAFIE